MVKLKKYFTSLFTICLIASVKGENSETSQLKLSCPFTGSTCAWSNEGVTIGDYNIYHLKYGQPYSSYKGLEIPGNYIHSTSNGRLTSPPLDPTGDPFCLSFYYYMFGLDVGTLSLIQITNKNGQQEDINVLWSKYGSNYDDWSYRSLTITPGSNYSTVLQFDITTDNIFLGPISASSGSCEKTINCDFEDLSTCSWTIESDVNYTNYKWIVANGEKPSLSSGNSPNKYLMTSNVNIDSSQATTRLISETFFSSWSSQCLKFNILKPDNKRDRVQVFSLFNNETSLKPIWSSVSLDNQKDWTNVQIPLTSFGENYDDYKIVITGDKYLSGKDDSTVVIDDLIIDLEPCLSERNCDFNGQTCGYIFDANSFLLGYGRLPDSNIFSSSYERIFSNEDMFIYNIPSAKSSDYILTSPIIPASKAVCLKFKLFFSGPKDAYLQMMINSRLSSASSVSRFVSLFDYDSLSKQTNEWVEYSTAVASEDSFTISFFFHGNEALFGVDDIKFEDGLCNSDSPTIGEVHFSENFEDEISKSNWLINTWNHKEKFDARFDYPMLDATNKYFGGYIYTSKEEAVITSKIFNGLGPYCLSFSYWCSVGESKLYIILNNIQLDINQTVLVKDCIGDDDRWRRLEKSFLINNDFRFSIKGSSENSKLAVDVVNLNIGSCSDSFKDSIECDFEADTYCPLEIESSVHYLWKVAHGYDLAIETEDTSIESKEGSVIALEFSFSPTIEGTSYFFLPVTQYKAMYCLEFSYKISCDCEFSIWIDDDIADVSSQSTPFTSINYNLGLRWYQKRVSLMLDESQKLIFGGTYNPTSHGSIILDDIRVKPGLCNSEFYCDFESECLWNILSPYTVLYIDHPIQTLTVASDWMIGMPNGSYQDQYPSFDYTYYDAEGSYIYTSNEQGPSVIASQPFQIQKGTQYVCLSFAYSLPYDESHQTSMLDIYLHYLDGSITRERQLTPLKEFSYFSWSLAELSISVDSEHQDNVLFLYIVGDGLGAKSIDNIDLNIGHCESKTTFECGDNEKVAMSSVCDFKVDCENGKDEGNCGNCTFDGGSCGYNGLDWETTNSYAEFVPLSYFTTSLTSPTISQSSSTCELLFEYQAEFPNSLTVELIMEHKNALKIWINNNYSNSSIDYWSSAQVSVGRIPHTFKIGFNAETESFKIYPKIRVRNVQFSNCGYQSASEIEPEKLFICSDGTRISSDRKCDGSFDCPKGDDETSCTYMVYNFETVSLNNNWMSSSSYRSEWTIVTGDGKINVRPPRDHTTGSETGHYAFLPYIQSDSKVETYYYGPSLTNIEGCVVTFYFNIPNSAFNLRLVAKNSETTAIIETLTEVTGQRFLQHKVRLDSISIKPPFNLNFVGVQLAISNNETSNDAKFIALDDIVFDGKCYSDLPDSGKTPKPSSMCSSEQFTCSEDNSCINKDYVCNGKPECPYGSDEWNCGACEFDSDDLCSWVNSGTNRWLTIEVDEASNNLYPSNDGSGNPNGKYLTVINKNKAGNAVLKSPILEETRDECVFNFRYFSSSLGPYLSIKLISNSFEKTLDILNPESYEYTWRSASVPLGGLKAGYQLSFTASNLPDTSSIFYPVGLDSFKMTNCFGDEKDNVNFDFSCKFEGTLCNWYEPNIASSSDLAWKISDNPSDVGTWHQLDEDYGYYIYLLRDNIANPAHQAILTSLWHSPIDSSCVTLTYRMFCRFGCSLTLSMEQEDSAYSTILMKKIDSQSNGWIKQYVNIKSSTQFRLVFNASIDVGQAYENELDPEDFIISLQSIQFNEQEKCPENGICDFELDNCVWSLDGLERLQAAAINIESDHSLGVREGHILNMNFKESTMQTSITADVNQSDKCLTFWTTPLKGQSDAISISYRSGTSDSNYRMNITLEADKLDSENQWIYRRINIPFDSFSSISDSGNLTIEFTIESDRDHFGIDDIGLYEKGCQPGNCDFEQDLCDWHNVGIASWLRNSGSTPSPYSGPDKDASDQLTGWYVFVDERELKNNNSAKLESETLTISPEICLTFDYHLYSIVSNQSNIGSIEIYMQDLSNLNAKILHTLSPSGSPDWQRSSFSLTNLPSEYRIIFNAIGGEIDSGDIALDNIQIVAGACAIIEQSSSQTSTSNIHGFVVFVVALVIAIICILIFIKYTKNTSHRPTIATNITANQIYGITMTDMSSSGSSRSNSDSGSVARNSECRTISSSSNTSHETPIDNDDSIFDYYDEDMDDVSSVRKLVFK